MRINYFTTIFFLFFSFQAYSQLPEVALRLSWNTSTGTARNQAIGGAMGSLGGDATALLVNPAGLAFFKTSDFILTPGFGFEKGKSNFRGSVSKNNATNKNLIGISGFISGGKKYSRNNTNTSSGIIVSKIADFNQQIFYKGQNNYSSFGEPLADEFAASNLTIAQALNSNAISLQTKMALYTYLVDTATIVGVKKVIARSELVANREQENRIETNGGITEITYGQSGEINDKLMVGYSFGIPIVNFNQTIFYREVDATGNTNNNFNFLSYSENVRISGFGINIKGGIIYRPTEYIRLGLAFHTPNFISLTEKINSGFAADVEKLFSPASGYDSVSSTIFSNNNKSKYQLATPSKILVSGAFVFREVEDVAKQKGFITADIEYVNYRWMDFSPSEENIAKDIFNPQNEAIKAIYKGTFNLKVGGELKFKTLMARAGFAYFGNPYKDKELNARKINLCAGAGYRNKGFFLDITYLHHFNKDVNFPYRVNPPRANTFAELKESSGNILLTFGFKIS